MPARSVYSAQPSTSVQAHSIGEWGIGWVGFTLRSASPLPSAPAGYGELPQFPHTSVVTPWRALLSPIGSSSIVTSEWECMSMKPGETTQPAASIRSAASAADRSPTAAILPPSIATSPR